MLPIRDENPTRRPPYVVCLLVLANAFVFLAVQQEPQRSPVEDLVFDLEYAAIPCELVAGRPLNGQEVNSLRNGQTDACDVGEPALEVFPDKNVYVALLVSMFLHGGWLHLLGNMLFLWIFGNNIEDRLGTVRFIAFYLLGGVAAAGLHVALGPDSIVPVIGASGAIAAVMGAYLVWFPDAPVRTVVFFFFIAVTDIRARWLLGFWFVSQFFTSPNSGVAWAAHVGGFVFGMAVVSVVRISGLAERAVWEPTSRRTMRPGSWDSTGGVGMSPYPTRRGIRPR